ncbi:MAG: PAS domain S-box protein [Deltaproteobacteria bacterium]|nr:PAS domain S-box protein [Deltaproteobacteria bacterium]
MAQVKGQAKDISVASPNSKAKLLARNRDLSALLAVAEVATQSLDIGKILNDTLDKSLEILGFDVGFIRILDSEGKRMDVRAARGLRSPEFQRISTPVDERRNVTRIVFETKEPYVCSDIRKNRLYKNRTMEREGVVSTAAAPVLSKNRVLGIIVAGSRKYHRFTPREIRLLTAFGSQLGMALENAELYDEASRSKAYIESLVESAGDAVISTDLEGRILTWNRAAQVIFGYAKDEALGNHLAILVPPGREKELEEIQNKVQLSGVIRNLEVRRKRKDGVVIDAALAVSPIVDEQGNAVGFLHLAKDITEKQRYEKRLKELDRMKSDFVSNVSHELRTPLTAIKGSVDNMLDGITGALNEKQMRYLARIKSNADRLSRLINELLDLSRIEAGKIDLRPADISLVALTREVNESLRPVAAEKLISLEVASPDTDVSAWAERDKVAQVLMNLIGNAVKFTPSHGKVTVGVRRNGDEWVEISIADTGPGIPAEEAGRIFDKFYQVAREDRHKTKGTGLGLAISKALVEMHGGKIWLESGAGRGSTFYFTLPARQPLRSGEPAGSGGG